MEAQDEREKGVCIVSFDGGGPGSISQLLIMSEVLRAVEYDQELEECSLLPADYWDLMGGVGFGGLSALLLGRLRISVEDASEELATIGSAVFPKGDEIMTPEANLAILRESLEDMLRRHGFPVDMKLNDKALPKSKCKVVVFSATETTPGHPHPLRTYSTRHSSRKCTFVDAACAILAFPQYFSPVAIGTNRIKQMFVGNPLGFNNPTRQVLEEALSEFGDQRKVSLILSLGSGRSTVLSRTPNLLMRVALDCERVARDFSAQLSGVEAYSRLDADQGLENTKMTDWHEATLGSIIAHTDVYLHKPAIKKVIGICSRLLQEGHGTISLAELNRTGVNVIAELHSRQYGNHLILSPTGVKQMSDIVRDVVHGITLVDAIGNRVQIPMEWCRTYSMLKDMVLLYFNHQKPPGARLVGRGDYRLVHGGVGNIVEPSKWTYDLKPGHMVEMSMVVHQSNEHLVKCPRCHTPFGGEAKNGWADCLSCSGRFQVEAKHASDDISVSSRLPSASRTALPAAERGGSQDESEEDGREQFRLVSVIDFFSSRCLCEIMIVMKMMVGCVFGVLERLLGR